MKRILKNYDFIFNNKRSNGLDRRNDESTFKTFMLSCGRVKFGVRLKDGGKQ
ncbi:hypothetical protein LEP1GSC193_3352 [Leptospira alstonii serovar Pingchang str. 80-412]|uniref:Uncharacterized protein n=2 Tax=Leptospira alstonii TaxID=28452 RepID=M6CJW4_9LEPT|nr:hypothetical protein LEP1GSC194_3488 [Leptospira alstonii serovar Sichuan str. 79601]EQA80569.1 hypothetical protein LEP1GSC193_3352 [Leptospira alstonii serovar Pingchang str. 80-412]